MALNEHCPVANPPTTLEVECESPNATAGLLFWHKRLPPTWLARFSDASGSVRVLFEIVALPPTVLRMAPSQQEVNPVIRRFPPTVLSS